MEVTVAKALKIKNEIAGEMKETMSLINNNNSREENAVSRFDVEELFIQYGRLFGRLVAVKAAIQKANAGICEELVRIAEMRGQVAFLKNLPTQEGPEYMDAGYREPARMVTKVAVITAKRQRDLVKLGEAVIRDTQDLIDTYNATTKIHIPDPD